jgi:hypothetical protein
MCISSEDSEFKDFTCRQPGKLENWKKFNVDHMVQSDDIWLGFNSVCQSHNAYKIDEVTYQCRPGEKSNRENEAELRREGNDQQCNYTTYNDDKATESNPVNGNDNAKCGFNKDYYAWCTKRKGDKWFTKAYEQVRALNLTTFNCHPQSEFDDCYAAFKGVDADLQWEFSRRHYEVDPYYGFYLIAHNSDCVAESITASFWQGRDPDLAFGIRTITGLLVVLCFSTLSFLL